MCTNFTPTKRAQWVKENLGVALANDKLMLVLDTLNQRFGRGAVKVSTQGAFRDWEMRQERKSPNYTTAWDEVPVV